MPNFVQHQTVQGLTGEFFLLVTAKRPSAQSGQTEQRLLRLHRTRIAAVNPFCVACPGSFRGCFLFIHAVKSGILEHLGTPQPPGHSAPFEHDVCTKDFAGARVDKTGAVSAVAGAGRRRPAQYVVADVTGVPIGRVWLDLDDHSVGESKRLEGLVPFFNPGLDVLTELIRGGVLNPPGDGLYRFGYGGGGVFFLQTPAVDHVAPGR